MIAAIQSSKRRVEYDGGYEVPLEIFSTEEEEQLIFRDWPAHIAAEHLAGIWIGLSTRKLRFVGNRSICSEVSEPRTAGLVVSTSETEGAASRCKRTSPVTLAPL